MTATGLVYLELGGPLRPVEFAPLAGPLIGAIATYFFVNTGLIAVAIALTSDRSVREVWLEEFSWSGASFMVAGTAGAVAAVVIARGEHWPAVLMLAPVYLTYRTYQVFIGRLEDRDRHAAKRAGCIRKPPMRSRWRGRRSRRWRRRRTCSRPPSPS